MTDTVSTTSDTFIARYAPDRARALRFLATRTAALGGAYSINISSQGVITLQGEAGALQGLVEMWGAQPKDDPAAGFKEWTVVVSHDPATVEVRLVEEAADREAVTA
jgi:hypothetical protein